jgi:hypothetical protein
MSSNGKIFAMLLVCMLLAFCIGAAALLSREFARGGVYPEYSSFRSDPQGSRALYLSLGRLPATRVSRNYLQPARLSREKGATFFVLGLDVDALRRMTRQDILALESFAARGNRLVFAFAPVAVSRVAKARGSRADGGDREKGASGPDRPREDGPCGCLAWRWKFIFNESAIETGGGNGSATALRSEIETGLPWTIPVRSSLSFQTDRRFWRTIYSVEGKPVLVERDFGRGSIVLLSDASLTSNGALRDRRCPELLLRLLGGNRSAMFDEAHLGISETPGVMSLVRKYRLTPFLGALFMLGALFVWKNAIPMVPPSSRGGRGGSRVWTDKDAAEGLVSLLRRHIPPSLILDLCFREWTKSFFREFGQSDGTRARLQSVVDEEMARPPAKRDPAGGYRRMARILAERKRT